MHTLKHTHTHTHTHTQTHTQAHTHTHIHTHAHKHPDPHVHTHTHTHTHRPTCTHTTQKEMVKERQKSKERWKVGKQYEGGLDVRIRKWETEELRVVDERIGMVVTKVLISLKIMLERSRGQHRTPGGVKGMPLVGVWGQCQARAKSITSVQNLL